MFLSHAQLKAAGAQLFEARKAGTHHCAAPRLDAQGSPTKTVERPKRRDGRQAAPIEIAHGAHDGDFLQINPQTGEIRCGACAGDLDATVN